MTYLPTNSNNFYFKCSYRYLKYALMFLIISFVNFQLIAQEGPPSTLVREQLSLNKGWRFHSGDIAFPEIKGHGMSYANAKAGKTWGAAAPEFDDTNWRLLNLPHDWAVEQAFDSTANLSQGYKKRGFGWYRRNFKLSNLDKGKHLEILFEGVATHCTVWFNGTLVNRNFCGYNSFSIDITAFAYYGNETNNLVVRVDAEQQEGWWYEGAGIYRNSWLIKSAPVHIITDGVFAQPIKTAKNNWTIPVAVSLENSGKKSKDVEILTELFHASGKRVALKTTKIDVAVLSMKEVQLQIEVANPEIWTQEHPSMYQVKTSILDKGKIIDAVYTNCGFRTIEFRADSGFYLNGKHVKLKGVCNHQDHAGVGVAVPDAIWEFRIRKLKEMGANAYRCAHNPPAASFLDACDRNGILVMDENRNFNVTPEYTRQLEWMVKRDRNHPSVILWSVFNEEPMQGTENGYELVRRMSAIVKKLDTSRPVTAAASGGLLTPMNVAHAVDVIGMNYQSINYDKVHETYPTIPITSSEDVSTLMVRGEYVTDKTKFIHDSYDTQNASWGTTHRNGWKKVDQRIFLAGCFIWTGFDYRGEPQPYEWPAASASFGIMDLCGFPKSAFYLHQAQWTAKPVLQLIPHWNWPLDSIGKLIKLMALTNVEVVHLYLNGKKISERQVDPYDLASWSVPFEPGKLEAIGFKNGKEITRFSVSTTGKPAKLQLIPDRLILAGDGYDAMPVTVQVLDNLGNPIPTASNQITFELSGPATIIGLGNGNPNSHESEKGNQRKLFNGLAQVILQSQFNGKGTVLLKAMSNGVAFDQISIQVKEVPQTPSVDILPIQLVLNKWQVSPLFTNKPDAKLEPAKTDMNSWVATKVGILQNLKEDGFLVYKTSFKPYLAQQKNGGWVFMNDVFGKAEIWLDNEKIFTKTSDASENLKINFLPKEGSRKLTVIFQGKQSNKLGLGGMVSVETANTETSNNESIFK